MKQKEEEKERNVSKFLLSSSLLLLLIVAIIIVLNRSLPDTTSNSEESFNVETTGANGVPYQSWRIKNLPLRDPLYYTTLSGNDVKTRVLSTWNPTLTVDAQNLRRWEMSFKNDEDYIDNAYTYEEIKLEKTNETVEDFRDWVTSKILEMRKPNDEIQIKQLFNLPHYVVAIVTDHTNRVAHYYISAVTHNYAYHIFYEEGKGSPEILALLSDILTQLTGINETPAATALMIDPFQDYLTEFYNPYGPTAMQWYEVASDGKYMLTFSGDDAVGTIRVVSDQYGDYSETYKPLSDAVYEYSVLVNKGDRFIFYGLCDNLVIKSKLMSEGEPEAVKLEPVQVYGFPDVKTEGYVYKTIKEENAKFEELTASMNSLLQDYDDVMSDITNSDVPSAIVENDDKDTVNSVSQDGIIE